MEQDKEKLKVLLKHWTEHNEEHKKNFVNWIEKAKGMGLDDVAKNLAKANKELKKIDLLKMEFLSLTSHELKTPLVPIRMYLDMFSDRSLGNLTKKQVSALKALERNYEKLSTLINQILDVVRIKSNRMKYNFKPTDMEKVIGNVLTDMKALVKANWD